jgi:hypothetical protein
MRARTPSRAGRAGEGTERFGATATESPYVDPDPELAEVLVAGQPAGRAGRFRPVMRMYQPRQVVQASELSVPRTTTHAH